MRGIKVDDSVWKSIENSTRMVGTSVCLHLMVGLVLCSFYILICLMLKAYS